MKISVVASTKEGYVAPKEEFDKFSGHSAGVCYMSDTYEALLNEPIERTMNRANDTKAKVHHSVFGHPHVSLVLEDVPKALNMVLNCEGIYNASERSARYKKMILPEDEEQLYNKWFEIFNHLIEEDYKKRYPYYFSPRIVRTLAQENARYLTSVFTPSTLEYTVSYQQLNYIYGMMKREIQNPSNAFMLALKPAMEEFCREVEKTPYIDSGLVKGAEIKNRHLAIVGSEKPEEYFGDVYATSYDMSFAAFAQEERHRTLDHNIIIKDEPKFFVPPSIKKSAVLTKEWLKDCESMATRFPQGMLVTVNEYGRLDWFIQKLKERKCSHAQLEINQQTNLVLNKYVEALRAKNHRRAEELAKYTKGARCTFPDYKCSSPCGFIEGINETREI